MSRRQSIFRVVFRLVSTIVFLVLVTFIILKLTGNQLNLRAGKIQPTGIIRVTTQPRNAEVKVTGTDYSDASQSPISFYNLSAGWYDITISLPDYQDWHKTVEVSPGRAIVLDDVVLVLKNPKPAEFKAENIGKLGQLYDPKDYPPLEARNDFEIWQQEQLVTRLSLPVSLVKWYPDEKHITYVADGKLWLIDIDGAGLQKIMDFTAEDYLITENGRSILIQTIDQISKFLIR